MNALRNKYETKDILINRLINLQDTASQISNISVKIAPKINEIMDYTEEENCKNICDVTLSLHGYIEYLRLDDSIRIKEINLVEEEFVKLPFLPNIEKITGEVKDVYTYLDREDEMYLSVYYKLIVR